jgi:hypothetical protein
MTPSYPALYQLNTICVWDIVAPPGKKIVLQFPEFDLESSPSCVYDKVDVIDTNGNLLDR